MPFYLSALGDGQRLPVMHPENVGIFPKEPGLYYRISPTTDRSKIVDLLLITGLEVMTNGAADESDGKV